MFKLDVKISGVENVIFNVNESVKRLPEKLLDILRKATLVTAAEAKRGAPVDTGLLRASINYFIETGNGRMTSKTGSAVFYAPYQEYGNYKHKVGHKLFLTGGFKKGSAKLISLLEKLAPGKAG